MTQDLIPVRREDVECAFVFLRDEGQDELASRLSAALNAPPSLSETTKDQAQPDLALQERGQEPVAWRWRYREKSYGSTGWMFMAQRKADMDTTHVDIEPLYRSPCAPSGWKLVPIVPTEEMIEAYGNSADGLEWRENARIEWAAMLAASPQAQQSEGVWQPIETAPKDGARVLVFRKGAKRYKKVDIDHWSTKYTAPCWAGSPSDEQPTHWMPLPIEPSENEAWPPRPWHCAHKNSCMRNGQCMYVGCVHNDRLPSPPTKEDQ